MNNFDLKKYLKEGKLYEENQSYEVISKETRQSEFGDKPFYDNYTLKVGEEDYTTPEGLTFHLLTKGSVLVNKDETLNFDEGSTHHFHYIQTIVSDKEGNELEEIPGRKIYGAYEIKPSINQAKKWLDKKGFQLMSGKGYQHKST